MTTFPPTPPPTPEQILASMDSTITAGLKPDPDLTLSQWADQDRVLSRVSAGEPGRWRTSRTPLLRDIMDCLSPSPPFSRTVFMKPAQIGGSEVLLNLVGYIVHYAPGPAMLLAPTVELAERFSQQMIAPLIENAAALAERVSDPRERDSGNTILAKEFPGGGLVATGANSSVGLSSMQARYLLMDEVDACPPSASTGARALRRAIRGTWPSAPRRRSPAEVASEELPHGSPAFDIGQRHLACLRCGQHL